MSREIRRVPPNWEHPLHTAETVQGRFPASFIGHFIPMHDQPFEDAAGEWKANFLRWEFRSHPDYKPGTEYWEYEGDPPDRLSFRPAFTEDPTWYQVYETVSEGTPVTPPFATTAELVDFLVHHGEIAPSTQGPISRELAESFVVAGSAVSVVVTEERQLLRTYETV